MSISNEELFMDRSPILSVDTSYDPPSAWFGAGRDELYRQLGGQFNILQLGAMTAERSRVLRKIAQAERAGLPYRAILVSSHGEPSRVLDDDSPDGELLSANSSDAELTLWARGRALYFCCCRSAQGPLVDRLLERGARLVVGFTGEPSWTTDQGRRIWRDLDLEIVKCVLNQQGAIAIERVRGHFLDRASSVSASEDYRRDLDNMQHTLETMCIQAG
jgi:hypothetical protein